MIAKAPGTDAAVAASIMDFDNALAGAVTAARYLAGDIPDAWRERIGAALQPSAFLPGQAVTIAGLRKVRDILNDYGFFGKSVEGRGDPEVNAIDDAIAALVLQPQPEGEVPFGFVWVMSGKWFFAKQRPEFSPRDAAHYVAQPLYLHPAPTLQGAGLIEAHKLDTDKRVFFYEQDFYVLSNFSAFSLHWAGRRFDTSEAAYHYEKFHTPDGLDAAIAVREAPSAHEAFKIAERNKDLRRPDWDQVKVGIMRDILRAKADQHEYVRRKLLATGDRELVEDSWRDDFWGWGPNRDGQNMLGKLWMEVRSELRAALSSQGGAGK